MSTKIVTVNEGVRDEIQALQYEVESRKDLLKYMVENGTDLHSEAFVTYHQEYQEFYVQLQTAKEDLQKNILEKACGDAKLLNWNLDFATCEVTCNVQE